MGVKKLNIKPLTILILIPLYTFMLLVGSLNTYWIILGISSLILVLKNPRKTPIFIGGFLALFLILIVASKHIEITGWFGSIYTMILIIIKLYPLWILSASLMSCKTSEIMNSLRRIRIPNNVAIAVAIFFRFLPDYVDYFKEIKEGMVVRNLRLDIRKPARSMELYIVPMINKAFQTSDIIASSLITKGIEFDCKKTEYRDMSLAYLDYIIIIVNAILCGVIF